jgi:hypothetical protein
LSWTVANPKTNGWGLQAANDYIQRHKSSSALVPNPADVDGLGHGISVDLPPKGEFVFLAEHFQLRCLGHFLSTIDESPWKRYFLYFAVPIRIPRLDSILISGKKCQWCKFLIWSQFEHIMKIGQGMLPK